jgi:hypothetical protein
MNNYIIPDDSTKCRVLESLRNHETKLEANEEDPRVSPSHALTHAALQTRIGFVRADEKVLHRYELRVKSRVTCRFWG